MGGWTGVPGQVSLTLSDAQTCLDLWYFLLLFSPLLILTQPFSSWLLQPALPSLLGDLAGALCPLCGGGGRL